MLIMQQHGEKSNRIKERSSRFLSVGIIRLLENSSSLPDFKMCLKFLRMKCDPFPCQASLPGGAGRFPAVLLIVLVQQDIALLFLKPRLRVRNVFNEHVSAPRPDRLFPGSTGDERFGLGHALQQQIPGPDVCQQV